MRKSLITLIVLTLPLFAFSQNKAKTTDLGAITKSKLSEIKLHSEIIQSLLKENKTFEIEISGKVGEALMQASGKSDEISEEEKNLFKKVNASTKLYFDVYYIEQTGKHQAARSYMLKVTK